MSEQVKHTPGPWFVDPAPLDNGLARIEDGREHGLFPITCEWTEAHVVAAATELYDRLDASTKTLIAERDCFYESVSLNDGIVPDADDRRTLADMDAAIDANRAVLAKARGEA